MIGKDRILDTLGKAVQSSAADHTEAVFIGGESGLTRFANNYIHQNVAETNSKVFFRVALGQKIGVASTNAFSATDLRRALKNAMQIAKNQQDNPHFSAIPARAQYPALQTLDEPTARFTPRQRATKLKAIFKKAAGKEMNLAGSFSTGSGELAIVNSAGVAAYQPFSSANVGVIAMTDTSSGFAQGLSRNVADLDIRSIGERAIKRAHRCRNPRDIEPGNYEVVLEPAAVAALLEWINYIGFGSKPFQEQTSFLSGKIGQKITGERFTVCDDATDEAGVAFPFDFEGVPKRKVELITNGVAKGAVYDSISAAREHKQSTGHALTPNYSGEGGLALNLFVAGGNDSVDDLIGGVENGLLVTRFHYINGYIDTPNAVLTGMTRDGLMRIKNGKLRGGVKNLRFTDSMLRAFSDIRGIAKERELVSSWWDALGCITAPAMRLGSFKFTGKTDF
jgi:predicted Zn-dependent protease